MAKTNKMLINVLLLGSLIIPIFGLARVNNHTSWRAANMTRHNSINQGWNSPTTQWNRSNQTAPGYSMITNNNRPQLNNPRMRNNQTSYPQYPQPNIGWGGRPNATGSAYGASTPANNNLGFTQSNWNRTQQNTRGGGGATYPQNQSGFNSVSGWNTQPTNLTRPYGPSTPTNTNIGSGQMNWNNSKPTTSWNGASPVFNGTFPGFRPPPQSQPNQAFGGGWNPGYNPGQTPPASPLTPIGGASTAYNGTFPGFRAPPQSQPNQTIGTGWNPGYNPGQTPPAAPLAPIGGANGGHASLSYANGQPLPIGGQQKPVGGSTNPYANLFN